MKSIIIYYAEEERIIYIGQFQNAFLWQCCGAVNNLLHANVILLSWYKIHISRFLFYFHTIYRMDQIASHADSATP